MQDQIIPIRELSEPLIHKIAAGEVVERPISVVKELVENSLDAGATRIEVLIENGGLDSIVIKDNGHGIPANQLSLALKRHATSKITQESDLFNLHTLGFRGEALAAISSVSKFRLESATQQSEPVGYVLQVEDGKHRSLQEVAMAKGTRIQVNDLFSTTPARLKFLKKAETEWGHIADFVTAMSLGSLSVDWLVKHNGKVFLQSPAVTELRQRVFDLFGKEIVQNLYPIDRQVSDVRIHGLVGHPNFSRKSNRYLFVFVNGRYVQDRVLNHAVVAGYRSLLMTQQYPMVFLNVEINPTLVDVNVHPSKREVRFAQSNTIHHLISETIATALAKAPWRQETTASHVEQVPRPIYEKDREEVAVEHVLSTPPLQSSWTSPGLALSFQPERKLSALNEERSQARPQARIGTLDFSNLRLIGQFHLTYLICEYEGSLFLIDQHAAHERIGFEKLKNDFMNNGLEQQALLQPIALDLSRAEQAKLKTCLPLFHKFSIEIDEFGPETFVVKAYPRLLEKCDWNQLVREVLDQLEPGARELEALEEKMDHILATMACHRQIRAKDRLTIEEMHALLQQLEGTPRSYHCPHGRPVMVELENREIEKWFKRVV